ncbi:MULTISPECIES: phosphate ABC transporter permease subunit PstC [Rhizobium/Agrobacterium group]|uniref:Phosphate transport system permease protein n=2 Tax=Neorhizobium TaxID=1525371 RepID=A0ABV0M2R6_9HYPH|nr:MULTISPECIES: phosphate ABC transporter permease subunit PstC [Rhizobium/Agrobacterium group]KGD99501.1 ABC transporter permease [Rhizobium sp. YS-1r]MCC2609588.1 phosphate ABC transporter permease subunit PstC [Neorhizobium petrolearium]WGI69789.1 phosphate ABC transporter permease subunit PstC [Neorhizobium petrolearium]
MDVGIIILILAVLAALGHVVGRRRALALAAKSGVKLHSLPGYYGQTVALFTAVPAFVVLVAWLFVQPGIVESRVSGMIPDSVIPEGGARSLVMSDVRRIAGGLDAVLARDGQRGADVPIEALDFNNVRGRLAEVGVALGGDVPSEVFEAAKAFRENSRTGNLMMTVVVLAMAVVLGMLAYRRIEPELRARNISESFVKSLLLGASLVAILTTIGIVGSLIFETFEFFQRYPAQDFFFSTVWNPQFRGGSDLGILPLLWGTFYVSIISLIVAVPLGLMIAVFLSEYAGPTTRGIVKPAIEVLAGIPTIVYGLFALVTVGPFLRDWLAQPLGLGTSSSSVLTAGLVMGIMIIPFVSSLSDDIINAVPQALRDGSYGLGATQSETIRQVVLPAALPGIVGAILLAASRAIGETMIVVLGAGAAAKLDLNPFEAMTTVTVKIVSQLTGDTEFGSPETLVAFALGLTLFVITLGLNVLALYIVRKYREQYE